MLLLCKVHDLLGNPHIQGVCTFWVDQVPLNVTHDDALLTP